MSATENCGRCHDCGAPLRVVLDGEEWCPRCRDYRRYRSHGWAAAAAEHGGEACPEPRKETRLSQTDKEV